MKYLFFIKLLLCICVYCKAQVQQGNALFEHLTTEQGLSSNEINCLLQDSRGFIWIGTNNGLNRYDGVDIVQYFQTDNNNCIAGNRINSIKEDIHHNLWIGADEGVSYFEPDKNKFTNYLTNISEINGTKTGNFNVSIDVADNIWVTTDFHLSLFNKQQKSFTHYKVDNAENLPITRNHYIKCIFEDSKKRLWLPTANGVQLFNRSTNQFIIYRFTEKEKVAAENSITCIRETSTKKIIASTWGAGVLIFNESKNVFEKLNFLQTPGSASYLINVIQDILLINGKVYCATSEGLIVLDEKDVVPGLCNRFTIYKHKEEDRKSISHDIITSLLVDKTGTLWTGSKGISKIDPLKQQFQNTFLSFNNNMLHISGIATYDDKAMIGAQDAYLFSNGAIKRLNLRDKMKSEYGEQIWDMYPGKKYLWLATTKGLIQLTKKGKFVKQYTHYKNNHSSIAGERLWKVYEDSYGLIWMCSIRRGLSVLNPETGVIKNYFSKQEEKNSLFNKYITGFLEDNKGNICFAPTEDKLYCYKRETAEFTVLNIELNNGVKLNNTPYIINQENESLILASNKGLLRYNSETQKATIIAFHNDMNLIKGGIVASDGNYWLITGNGLLQYNPTKKEFKRFTTHNGLPSNEEIEVIRQMPNGNFILGGMGFVSIFNPNDLGNNKNIPVVQITQVLANSKDTLLEGNDYLLPYLSGIRFDFAALSFSNASQNMYKYRLIGIDADWSKPTHQRSVSYAQLPSGNYTFEVMGSNSDGMWNEKSTMFQFSIKRPFYKAWWFYLLLALITIGGVYSLYRYRLRKAIELEKMRTRIATDLHDDIGATLSSISMYSESLKDQVKEKLPHLEPVLDKMGENSREMVASMSDIVWAINPENDNGEKLIKRMESYATDICAAKNISLDIQCEESLQKVILPLHIRKNVYLIFKEAVNNAAKYSGAKNILVSISYEDMLTMAIKDNGKGFDVGQIREGNGLKNFVLRANEISGVINIESTQGNGTKIILTCPI